MPHACHVRPTPRRGGALLVALFVMMMSTLVIISIFEIQMLAATAARNTGDYERAGYLAGAAAHHACAELEANAAWRTGIPATEFPVGSGNSYSATVVDGSTANEAVITAAGTAGSVTRTIQVTVDNGS